MGSSRAWLAAFVAVAVVVAIAVVHLSGRTASAVGGGDGLFGTATAHPPEHQFPDPTRIFPAVAQVPGTGGYTVLNEHAGRPVGWDPCEPVHFVVRDANAIPGGRALLDRAMAEVSKDTGLYFMDDGATGETPTAKRNPYQPAQYGQNWVPVLIAWSNPAEFPALAGDVIGLASPVAVGGRDARIVSGEVVFDAPELQRVEALPDGSTYAYDVMLHELGHLVGLGHIADPSQIMNPETVRPLPGYGTGDLRGLAVLGSGRCFTKG